MEQRQQRVVIETARHRITGAVTMPTGGFRSRLSDYLNHSERNFIALTDAIVEPLGTGEAGRREFVVVGRDHIVVAMPADGNGAGGELDAI
jgi:hypothetical protein